MAVDWDFDKPKPPAPWLAPQAPAVPDVAELSDTVKRMQADMRMMVSHTCIMVRAEGPKAAELGLLANTKRGQHMPSGKARYSEGHTIEFVDLGMPQPGAPEMTIEEMVSAVYYAILNADLRPEL